MVGTLSLTRVAEKSLPPTHRSTYGEQNTTQDCHPRRSALVNARFSPSRLQRSRRLTKYHSWKAHGHSEVIDHTPEDDFVGPPLAKAATH